MNKRKAIRVLNALRKLQTLAEAGSIPYPDVGICFNLDSITQDARRPELNVYGFLGGIFEEMGHNRYFPLGYDRRFPMYESWLGGNLTLRLDLMSKIITYIEITLEIQAARYYGGGHK